MLYYLFMILLFVTAVFLIVIVLIQRGKGGGLAGALGGMGGQSAFGTKAGDLFTKITIFVALFWILLCMGAVKYFGSSSGRLGGGGAPAQDSAPAGQPGDQGAPGAPPAQGPGQDQPSLPAK
jgi:preprotein translocase subunit SecG